MSDGIVEVRDYTIEPEWFDAYRDWARDLAGPWLMSNLDVIDFWCDDGEEAIVSGKAPSVSPNGQPNVCWIIRWPDRERETPASRPSGPTRNGRRSGPSTPTPTPTSR